jgi:HSP20 family protein
MERMMDHLLQAREAVDPQRGWVPRVDIYETEQGLLVTVELPGVSREGIEITVEGSYLRISGVREEPAPSGCVRWHHMEIAYGSFERVVALPRAIDAKSIRATYLDGFLRIEIPSAPPAPRQVPITEP